MEITVIKMPDTKKEFDTLVEKAVERGFSIDEYSMCGAMPAYSKAGWVMVRNGVLKRVLGYGTFRGSGITYKEIHHADW